MVVAWIGAAYALATYGLWRVAEGAAKKDDAAVAEGHAISMRLHFGQQEVTTPAAPSCPFAGG